MKYENVYLENNQETSGNHNLVILKSQLKQIKQI